MTGASRGDAPGDRAGDGRCQGHKRRKVGGYGAVWGSRPPACTNTASVTASDGKRYCKVHDPDARQAKRDARSKERREASDREHRIRHAEQVLERARNALLSEAKRWAGDRSRSDYVADAVARLLLAEKALDAALA